MHPVKSFVCLSSEHSPIDSHKKEREVYKRFKMKKSAASSNISLKIGRISAFHEEVAQQSMLLGRPATNLLGLSVPNTHYFYSSFWQSL